jgi:hypothetical protein
MKIEFATGRALTQRSPGITRRGDFGCRVRLSQQTKKMKINFASWFSCELGRSRAIDLGPRRAGLFSLARLAPQPKKL